MVKLRKKTLHGPMAVIEGCGARAKELHADEKLSFRMIADVLTKEFKLTPALTASAMSGFYFREGIKRGKSGRTPLGTRIRVVKTKRDNDRANKIVKGAHGKRGNIASPEPMSVEPEEGLLPTQFVAGSGKIDDANFLASNWKKPTVKFRNLEAGMCKWPIECEDLTTEFCGAPIVALNYCCDHAVGAYRLMPTEKRNAAANKKQDLDSEELRDPIFSKTGDHASERSTDDFNNPG